MRTQVLLLDAGNTRLKWAVVDLARASAKPAEVGLSESDAWLGQGATAYHELAPWVEHWQQWGTLSACYGVRVAHDASILTLQRALAPLGLEIRWLSAGERAGGVHNTYLPPQSLGADRWAALVAVRQRTAESAVVVSAGTALTVDALDAGGDFLGGMILPGLQMMRHALGQDTANIGMQYGKLQAFPNTTADAVESGLISACTGAIATMQANLEKKSGSAPRIFLTGGDGASLRFFLPAGLTIVPGLVLEGVYYLSLEEQAQ